MLELSDFPRIIRENFQRVYVMDTEYYGRPGLPNGPVTPVCLQAYELRKREWITMFFEDPTTAVKNPLDPDALYVLFNASAEWGTFLSLGWQLPKHCLDGYIEFKNQVSGLIPPPQFRNPNYPDKWKASMLDVLRWKGLPTRPDSEKKANRDLVLHGHPYSVPDRQTILDYCREDVVDTARVCKALLPAVERVGQAIIRGHFMRAVARIQLAGIPVDVPLYRKLIAHRDALRVAVISELVGTPLNVYTSTRLTYAKLTELIKSLGLETEWPRPKKRRGEKRNTERKSCRVFSTELESFESMALLRPELKPLAQVVKRLRDLKTFNLEIGVDGRSRYPVFPFDLVTGRNNPPVKQFLLSQSSWTRGFIRPPRNWAMSYLDFSAAEVLIAAVLSGDKALLDDYMRGDPYTNCAIRMRLAPENSSKESIGPLRDVMKIWLLSTLYGASASSLHSALPGSTLGKAKLFIQRNRSSYERYWDWSNDRTELFMLEDHRESTKFGWQHQLDPSVFEAESNEFLFWRARNRSRNFPMQAGCAEVLRHACVAVTDAGIEIHAPLHDAMLIGAPDGEIEKAVAETRKLMITASETVLGVPMKVPVPEIIRFPHRLQDKRGIQTWTFVMEKLKGLRGREYERRKANDVRTDGKTLCIRV